MRSWARVRPQLDSPFPRALRHRRVRQRVTFRFALSARELLLAIVLLAGLGVQSVSAADEPASPPERAVKAAYLYKFLAYVEWPVGMFAEPESPFVIGVVQADDIAMELASVVASRSVNGRTIQVRRMRENDAPAGIHMLFIGRGDRAHVAQAAGLAYQQPRPPLVVTESEGALDTGSMINLVLSEGRVRFEVSLDNAERAGLKLSSRLLSVAQQVRTAPP
jgi:hypothetical protein